MKPSNSMSNNPAVTFLILSAFILSFTSIYTAETDDLCSPPPQDSNFSSSAFLRTDYRNWAHQIALGNVLTVIPTSADDVLQLANWAFRNGYKLRGRGFMHNWSPLLVTGTEGSCNNIVLVDTTKFLNKMEMTSVLGGPAVVVETGASLELLLTFLEENDQGITGHPAPGDITIGGALAIGGHGTGVPLERQSGNTGTLSNLVLSIDAIVWNKNIHSYEIRTFERNDKETAALLVNLGRTFITKVTLHVFPLINLRCLSRLDISASALFEEHKPTGLLQRDLRLSRFVEESGSVEVIWFPFTHFPWLKIWTHSARPLTSRKVLHPYNYPFSDNIPIEVSDLAKQILAGHLELTPTFGAVYLSSVAAGLTASLSFDLWGPSKNLLLYVKPTTLRVTANGYVLITKRERIQPVLHKFTTFYKNLIDSYAEKKMYPINGPLEIRVTGIDQQFFPNFEPPTLSTLKPVEGRPDLDTGIWIDCLTFPNTANSAEFMKEVEAFLLNMSQSDSEDIVVRPEWSKGFAYTNTSTWSNADFLSHFIPSTFGRSDWDFTVMVFEKYDPHLIFTNFFLRELLK